jgi:hypothetical protein
MGLFDELWMRMFDRMFADHYSGHVRDNLEILVWFLDQISSKLIIRI